MESQCDSALAAVNGNLYLDGTSISGYEDDWQDLPAESPSSSADPKDSNLEEDGEREEEGEEENWDLELEPVAPISSHG